MFNDSANCCSKYCIKCKELERIICEKVSNINQAISIMEKTSMFIKCLDYNSNKYANIATHLVEEIDNFKNEMYKPNFVIKYDMEE